MLVLSRKMNESIVIGENIVVTVIDIRGGQNPARHRSSEARFSSPARGLRADQAVRHGRPTSSRTHDSRHSTAMILGHGPIIPIVVIHCSALSTPQVPQSTPPAPP